MVATTTQIKSRQRVRQHGEVFTAEREVKAMCDLVDDECRRLASRFLEPSCGTGNFLVEILRRKLSVITSGHDLCSVIALSSIYGIDLMPDNVETSKARMMYELNTWYLRTLQSPPPGLLLLAWRHIANRNITQGNALTMQTYDGSPITFSQWCFDGETVCRRDFRMADLMQPDKPGLFDSDPAPIKEYEPKHYLQLHL